jgi:hypothetical protein
VYCIYFYIKNNNFINPKLKVGFNDGKLKNVENAKSLTFFNRIMLVRVEF